MGASKNGLVKLLRRLDKQIPLVGYLPFLFWGG